MKTYCTQCGSDNSGTAVFCRKCGVLLEKEEETRVVTRSGIAGAVEASKQDIDDPRRSGGESIPDEDGDQIFSISPTLMFVKLGYATAAVAAVLLVGIVAAFLPSLGLGWVVIAGLLLFLIPGFYHFKQKLIRYTLTGSTLEIDEGLISRRTRNLPISRIQDVTVSMTVLQRMLGFGDLVVDNASDEGGKVTLANINSPRHYSDMLLRQMKRLEK